MFGSKGDLSMLGKNESVSSVKYVYVRQTTIIYAHVWGWGLFVGHF